MAMEVNTSNIGQKLHFELKSNDMITFVRQNPKTGRSKMQMMREKEMSSKNKKSPAKLMDKLKRPMAAKIKKYIRQ